MIPLEIRDGFCENKQLPPTHTERERERENENYYSASQPPERFINLNTFGSSAR
jgi:hypothetical protein